MKKYLSVSILALAIFAGVFFTQTVCAEESRLPWNVSVVITHGKNTWRYDMGQFVGAMSDKEKNDRGVYLGCRAKKKFADSLIASGLPEDAVYDYVLPGFGKLMSDISAVTDKKRIDASVVFHKNGSFTYCEGSDGSEADRKALFEEILSQSGKRVSVILPIKTDKAVTTDDLKKVTVKKASFTTSYEISAPNRCFNIEKAASAINGRVVLPGETFSFNDVVGERSEANGYKTSKVIVGGTYTDGVGGGVCQVSTTLYNALILSEIFPDEVHQHTLVPSYVKPGFDAMVSSNSADLKFTNNTNFPLYIHAATVGKRITFTLFGAPNRYVVKRESVERERIKYGTTEICDGKTYPDLIYTDQFKVVTSGSDGVKSSSYLLFYDGEKLVERRLIRQNNYKLVNKVVARGSKLRQSESIATET